MVVIVYVFQYLGKEVLEVVIGFQIVCFHGFHDAVDNRAKPDSSTRVNHHPVLFADAESADGLFGGIVVHRNLTVNQEHFQVFFLVERIAETFPCLAFL